jgi:hypothetical protein
LVLERYGVIVLKLAQSKVVLKALLSPGEIHYLKCGCRAAKAAWH